MSSNSRQLDRALRVFVVEVASNPRYPYKPEYPLTVLINPEIEFMTEDKFDNYEGCLSIPNLRGMVPRCPSITVKGLDRHFANRYQQSFSESVQKIEARYNS